MAHNLTITILEGLHERLQKVRGDVHVARICQKAIEEDIVLKESYQKVKECFPEKFFENHEIVIIVYKKLDSSTPIATWNIS